MKFLVSVSNQLVMDADRLKAFIDVIDGCEVKVSEWVGTGKGMNGTNYIEKINQPRVEEMLTLKAMSDIEYDSFVTMAKLRAEAE